MARPPRKGLLFQTLLILAIEFGRTHRSNDKPRGHRDTPVRDPDPTSTDMMITDATVSNPSVTLVAWRPGSVARQKSFGKCRTTGQEMWYSHYRALCCLAWVAAIATVALGGPLPRANREQDLSDHQRAGPVVVYHRLYTAPCFADYVPSPHEAETPFVVNMAGNEHEPMQVGLYVPRDTATLRDVKLEVQCDVSVRVGHVYTMPEDELSWQADTSEALLKSSFPNVNWPVDTKLLVNKRSSIPLYVLPLDRIGQIDPGRSAVFWLTFSTQDAIAPGAYRGVMRLTAAGRLLRTIPFVVEVYPFTLPRPKIIYAFYYVPYQTPPHLQGKSYQKQYLTDMAAHGMNMMQITVDYSALSAQDYDLTSSTPHDDFWTSTAGRLFTGNYLDADDYQADGGFNVIKFVEAQIMLGRQAGLVQMDQPLITHQSNWNASSKDQTMAALAKYSQEYDWPDMHLYMRDEPGPKAYDEVVEHVGQWRRLGASAVAAMSGQAALAVGHVHDVWIVLAGHITPELLAEAGQQVAQVWTYSYSLRTTNCEAGRYFAGLYTWSLELAGNMPYAYMGEPGSAPEKQAQPAFDADWKLSGPSVLGYVIPSPAGPVPGVGFEGRREGVDDVRYLQLLEARVSAAAPDDSVAADAKAWLDRLRLFGRNWDFTPDGYNAWGADWYDPHAGIAPDDYHAIRAEAAAWIVQLAPAANETNPEPDAPLRRPAQTRESAAYENRSVEDCVAALTACTAKQRRQAAAALALRNADEVYPAMAPLIALLDDPQVRIVAARALAVLGPRAKPAAPMLRQMLKHHDSFIQNAANYVLNRIEPPNDTGQ